MIEFTINGLVYETINDKEVILEKTEGLKRPVRNIPAEVEYGGKKYKVTEVYGGSFESDAFYGDGVLTSLSLPETIISIRDPRSWSSGGMKTGAFRGCTKLKDIYFPDSLEETADMDSSDIVKFVYDKMEERHYEIGNVDINITLEQPKLKNYRQQMRENVARLLNTNIDNISIKAGTNEGLDDVGHGMAIRVDVVVLLNEK